MTLLRFVRLLPFVLLGSLGVLPPQAAASQHSAVFLDVVPHAIQLFTPDSGWAVRTQADQRGISVQDPKDPDRPDVVQCDFRRAVAKEGIVSLSFYTYPRSDWARNGFNRACRSRFDAHAAPSVGGIRGIHTASQDGNILAWGMQVAPGGAVMASFEVCALGQEAYYYSRADLKGISAETAERVLQDMQRLAEIFRATQNGSTPAPLPVPESPQPVLDLQAAGQPVGAGGEAQITATLSERQAKSRRPLAGRTLSVALVAAGGPAVGQLSASTVVTDAAGQARLTYTAPEREKMPAGAVPRALVRVTSADPPVTETLPIDLDNRSALSLKPAHPIIPAQSGFGNTLTVRFEAPRGERGREYTARLRCGSGGGRLATLAGGGGQRELVVKLASGMDNHLLYRWDDPIPRQAAVTETVTAEITDLKLQAATSFSVGMDLMLESVRLSWKGPFYPGMALPVEAALADRFHPDADLAALLAELKIEPALELIEKRFAPLPLGSTLSQKFLANLVHTAAGAFIPKGSITRGLPFAEARRSDDGRWLMLWKDQPLAEAFPQVMPNDMGNYLFEVSLDPRLEADPDPEMHTTSLQVSVQEIPPEEEIVFTFALPTVQAMAAFSTPLKAVGVAWNVAGHLHEGNPAQAARELGKAYLMPEANKWIANKVKDKGLPYVEALLGEMRERLPSDTVAKLERAIARETGALDEPWVKGMIEQFELDMVEGAVGAITNGIEEWVAEKAGIGPKSDAFLRRWWAVQEAWAAPATPQLQDAARFFQQFLKGNDRYGVLIVSRRGLAAMTASDMNGRPIPIQAGGQIFDHFGRHGRQLGHVVVIPFKRGEQFRISLAGEGDVPVKLFKVLGDGLNHGILGGTGQRWEKSLLVDGTAVR